MVKRRVLTMMILLGFLLSPFSGSQPFLEASAETAGPPTLSSEGFQKPETVRPKYQPTLVPAQAVDDYIPPEGDLPVIDQAGSSQPAPLNVSGSDSGQTVDINASEFVLYDNGPLITHPGGGFSGNNASATQTALGLSVRGFNAADTAGFRIADDFEITDPEGWQVDNITFFSYQTATLPYPPVSPLTGIYLQIWNGQPGAPGSAIIFGDLVTNRMTSTSWAGIYRVFDTGLLNVERPVMKIVAQVGRKLSPGTYWLDWTITGSLTSGPWVPPVSILGQTTTGNAIQTSNDGETWQPANDTATSTQQGMPFVIRGTLRGWLWDQSLSSVHIGGYVNQEFPDQSTLNAYLADDFIVENTWMVRSIFVPGLGWGKFTSLMNASLLTWKIYGDNSGVPAGDPSGGGNVPIWSLSLTPTDSKVSISDGNGSEPSNTLLTLPSPIYLPPGHYWLVFYPTMTFGTFGQYGREPADSNNGNTGQFINPGGAWGHGTNWQNWSVIGGPTHDIAFSIGGEIAGNWKSIAPLNSIGRSRSAATTVNGKIYVMGGETSDGRANTVERYDPQTNTWTTRSGLMPIPASNICAAAIGTDIYVPGGYDVGFTSLNTLQVYHASTDTWTTVTTDPLPLSLYGVGCAALNGKLYIFGGTNTGAIAQDTAYVYDPEAAAGSRWTTLSAMNTHREFIAGVAVGGKIYAIGGINVSVQDLSSVEVFDPADGMWHVVTNLNVARGGAGAYSVGNTIFVCGGGFYYYYRTCEYYDTNKGYEGSWLNGPSLMLQGRRTFAFANIGPVLYAIAGYNGSYLRTAERWSFDTYLPSIMK